MFGASLLKIIKFFIEGGAFKGYEVFYLLFGHGGCFCRVGIFY